MKKLPKGDAEGVPGGVSPINPDDVPQAPDYPQYPGSDGGCTNPPTK